MKLTTTKTLSPKPEGIIIYSKSGLGKTSFLVDAVNDAKNGILFQCGEDGISDLIDRNTNKPVEVPHYPEVIGASGNEEQKVKDWQEFKDILTEIINGDYKYDRVGFDNLDNIINNNLTAFILDTYYKDQTGVINTKEAFGWGGAYLKEAYGELSRIVKAFEMIQSMGISVYVSLHGQSVKEKDPRSENYDKYSFEVPARADYNLRNLLINWSSATFFGTIDATVDKGKAKGTNRVLMTSIDVAYDAKNRYSLPDKMTFEYKSFKELLAKRKEK